MSLHTITTQLSTRIANDYETEQPPPSPVNQAAIQQWLAAELSEYTGLDPAHIDITTPCTEYGLDSIAGVSIAGDLELWLDLQLSPTLLWDYPSIALASEHLFTMLNTKTAELTPLHPIATAPQLNLTLHPDRANQLLSQLETLSHTEVEELLDELLAA